MKEQTLAEQLLKAIGGPENIKSSWNCATRLRIIPYDENKIDENAIKDIEGVIGLVHQGDQYQIVIGNSVNVVYEIFQKLLDQQEDHPSNNSVNTEQTNQRKKTNVVSKILNAIVGSITPMIPVLVAGGMGKCVVLLLNMAGVLPEASTTYQILFFIFDSAFYFLPVFVAMSAARHFETNIYLAALVGCTLINPSFIEMTESGADIDFLSIPVLGFSYASTLIPSIVAIWILSYVDRFFNKHLWVSVRRFLAPLLSIFIVVPLTIVIIGPAMMYVSQGISEVVFYLSDKLGFLSIAFFSLLYPWIVTTGMHSALAVAGLDLINTNGFDPFTRVLTLMHNITQASATFAIALRTKNPVFKGTAVSASLTALLAGITEPCLYGVTLKLRKPMYACMIGGFSGGLYAGITGVNAYIFLTPGLVSLPMWINPSNTGNLANLWNAVIAMLIAAVITFIATWILGFEDVPVKQEQTVEAA